jgi:hypothetical protein
MSEKTTARITTDGKEITLSGDTVIAFSVTDAIKCAKGESKGFCANAGFFGYEIPKVIFSETMADMIGSLVSRLPNLNSTERSFLLYEIGERLEKKSMEIASNTPLLDKFEAFDESVKEMLKEIFG